MLEKFIQHKKEEVARKKRDMPLSQLATTEIIRQGPSFRRALSSDEPALIAEIKYASPSHGSFNISESPTQLANLYETAGANAISVLTDERFFQGSLDNLRQVSGSTPLPTLCKDFIIDPYQLHEARHAGASAALLMVSILQQELLEELISQCRGLSLTPVVEVRDSNEADRALEAGAKTIGVNNRNLEDLSVDLQRGKELITHFRDEEDLLVICESGISTRQQIEEFYQLGYQGFLIGTSLMQSGNPAHKLRELRGQS
jgi:indole-3-glycerol phosphate synthase